MTRPGRDEQGQVGGLEAVAFGLLILVVGVLLVSNAWGVIDAKSAARTAAREAARAYAKAPTSDGAEAEAEATRAARDTLDQLGWHRTDIDIHLDNASFQRCAVITYVVTIPVPAFRLPFLHGGPSSFHATARHTERVDPYRSGVPGDPALQGGTACAGPL